MKYTKLGDLLVNSGAITSEQLDVALKQQSETGERLGEALQQLGFITEHQIIDALMNQLGVEFIDLNTYNIPSEMAQILPKNIAKKYMVVPVKATRNEIWLAMADPLNFVAQEEVAKVTKRNVIPMIATTASVERAVQNLYSNEGALRAIEDMQRELTGDSNYGTNITNPFSVQQVDIEDSDDDIAPAIRLVNSIIDRAFTEGASDIHLEPTDDGMVVRMRIDGVLRPIIQVPAELVNSVISRVKIMSHMDIAQKTQPQDGRAQAVVRQEPLDLRVSTLPTIHGEKIVMRLLRKSEELSTIDGLGLTGKNLETFKQVLDDTTEGVILIVGPTGSGKTSTMYAIINALKNDDVNLVSLEDPVEYSLPGVVQVQVNDRGKLSFAEALRSVLRQDPDIIAVGEIRDGETAEIAMRSAMTGHLVFSTIHTNNAASVIDRLMDIGVEPYLIAGATKAIISQRLLRRVCPTCTSPYKPTEEEVKLMGFKPGDYTFFRGKGCPDCFNTGYRGRTGAFEILRITPAIRHAIHSGSIKEIEAAIKESDFVPIMEDCRSLVLSGKTTVEEVYRVIGA